MYKAVTCATFILAASAALQAEPALYRDGIMTIPGGAVVSDEGNAFYTDITMALDTDGRFVITGAERNNPVAVDSVDTMLMESFPVQVSVAVSGNLSVPCVELLDPAIAFADNTFTVILAESNLGPAESCIAVLEPFETTIPLDVAGLPAGTYTVDVNGVTTEFTLDVDNTPGN